MSIIRSSESMQPELLFFRPISIGDYAQNTYTVRKNIEVNISSQEGLKGPFTYYVTLYSDFFAPPPPPRNTKPYESKISYRELKPPYPPKALRNM
jgi:hypothetical protein